MKRSIYQFLKECALRREPIKTACEREGVNPTTVRKFLRVARRRAYLRRRVVKKGKYVGFRYDGAIVFWDRVEEVGREGEPETRGGNGL